MHLWPRLVRRDVTFDYRSHCWFDFDPVETSTPAGLFGFGKAGR